MQTTTPSPKIKDLLPYIDRTSNYFTFLSQGTTQKKLKGLQCVKFVNAAVQTGYKLLDINTHIKL